LKVKEERLVKRRKVLVVVVDRDDDLGQVGIRTPVLGRSAVLDAALRFALERPEDSDSNVLFAGLKLLDRLRREGYDANIVVVSGHPYDSVEADMRIRDQVRWAVEVTGAREVVLVSDGAEDELTLPVIQQVADVVSVKRVVVEQHRGLEETLILFARYVRKAVEEPRFARLFLGVPGLVLIVFSSLALVGYLWHAILLGLLVGGVAMVIRGFGLEERVAEIFTKTPVTAIAYTVSGIIAATAAGLAYYQLAMSQQPSLQLVVETVRGLNAMMGLAASIAIISHAVNKLVSGNIRVSKEVTALAVTLVVVTIVDTVASSLQALPPEALTSAALPLQLQQSIALYALGGVLVIALVWKLSSYLEEAAARARTS
jgi:putative membrane protein